MAELKDVLAYLLQRYPRPGDLSNARVTKMVYLADWRHTLEEGRQITNIVWMFDHYGPFVWDVMRTVYEHKDLFKAEETATLYGNRKVLISCTNPDYEPRLTESEATAIDHVIHATKGLDWQEFIGLVYSTYPVVSSERYSRLDLKRAAEEYKRSDVYRRVSPS